MKKGKLYTVTPWNKQAFVKTQSLPTENIFWPGGDINTGGIGNFSGQVNTAFGTNSGYGAAGNPFTPGSTAFNHYNIQSVENSISNGSYFDNRKKDFTYKPQNYVKGIDFTTDYNDTSQRFSNIANSAINGINNWKADAKLNIDVGDTSGLKSDKPGWSSNPFSIGAMTHDYILTSKNLLFQA